MRRPRIDDPDLTIQDLLDAWPQATRIFLRHKMLCIGCMITPFHTVIDACAEHGVDEDTFRAELAEAVAVTSR
ncbi:DUF1858 domain-containing protein [Tranquillimonas alkanivorans]|uniref:Hybrid cluster protein-associated redox disulfide domain-containing protein n=1 Tax=Tranquillimonas alkanivorans TaxID=441119 RepID=A0A1I5X351_9RHOB|nr:DUF1858 domain-containing protein [Tranquillimonas alkanivorans]SFQ26291.1 hybrid cluster protein-associated redox disulfide domain-containing protein [Tranquillimonas alkanivorans]